jgi:hypothetical protein
MNREMDLVAGIEKSKSGRTKGLFGLVALLGGYLVLRYFGVVSDLQMSFDLFLFCLLIGHFFQNFAYPNQDEQYKDLLQKYVSNDPEALAALAERNRARSEAAG